ncbi:NUDIX hydrolase domain-like protein [Podospora fimiseda]|uniref:NUDIX hydrolase domain-like protein n=1 Tax=Podospora fimiseda TaxID=252190 RepID=A0AAN6YRP1_9PEZI|nr:NUDIX hydrolase domain-like protein [Podospora fimiseda]
MSVVKQPPYTMLDLVKIVDTWPYPSDPNYNNHLSSYYTFHIPPFPHPFGYIHRDFVQDVPWFPNLWNINHQTRKMTFISPPSFHSRSEAMRLSLLAGHQSPNPVPSLRRWTNEEFPLLYPPTREVVLKLDGCGVDMLGGINETVCVVAYVTIPGQEHKLWISKRAWWKSAYPRLWDCTAGGGLAFAETPLEGMVREAWEEVGLPKEWMMQRAKKVGENSFQLCRTEIGEDGCQMQVQHLFEVDLSGGEVVPDVKKAMTEECEEVRLVGVGEVKRMMRDGEMKPGAAMVILDWMIRWGYVSEETEGREGFEEIKRRLKRRLVIE